MSDTYQAGGSRRGRSPEEIERDLIEGQSNPEAPPELGTLIDQLTELQNSPELSAAGAARVQDLLEGLDSGDSPLAFNDPRDLLNGGPDIVGGAFKIATLLGSGVLSGINQIGAGLREAGVQSNQENFTNQDRFSLDGFLSGLSTGDDPVSGLDLLYDREYQADGLAEGGFFDPGTRIPIELPFVDTGIGNGFLPDSLPAPDYETLLGLGIEIGTDPLTFVRAPGVLLDDAKVAAGVTSGSAATSRAGRLSQVSTVVRRGTDLGLSDDILEQAVTSIREGGITTLIRDARKGVNGLTPDVLSDLGVQRGLTLGGKVIPYTEGAASAFGAIRAGATAGRFTEGAFQKLGEFINQSALTRFASNLAEAKATPLEIIRATDAAKAVVLQSRQGINLSGDAVRDVFARVDEDVLGELSEKQARELLETDEILTEQAAAERLASDPTRFQRAVEDFTIAMDEAGIGVSDVELTSENLGSSFLDRYVVDQSIDVESRILAPALHHGLVELQRAARRFGGEPANGRTFTAAELVGEGGYLNRQIPTLRRFHESVAMVGVFGRASRLDTIGDDLADKFFNLGNSVPDELLDHFGQLGDDLDAGLSQLDELTGASEALAQRAGDRTIPAEFEKFIVRSTQSAYDALASGDLTAVTRRLEKMIETGNAHTAGLTKLVRSVTRGDGAAILNADRAAGGANIRRARALDDEALESRVHQILKNEWFNPELTEVQGSIGQMSLLSAPDRAYVREAYKRNPEMVQGVLGELDSWINEWTDVAQETFRKYDEAFSPEVAAQLKEIDAFYHQALASARVFGQTAEEAAVGLRSDVLAKRFTREEADALADQIQDVHGKAGQIGVSPGMWSNEMHEVSKFVNSLRRADFGEKFGAAGEAVAKYNRAFRNPQLLFGSGFISRNFLGQLRVNFLNGVRVTGKGGYREYQPVHEVALRALREETINFSERGTSEIWKELPEELRAQGIELADSGVLTTSSVGGAFERAFEVQEQTIGSRGLGRVADAFERGQTRIEQAVVPAFETLTSGRRTPISRIDFTNTAEGIQATTRREMESYARGALMWSTMRKRGGTIQDGLHAVSRNHFDYWDLTPQGQVVDELMPFWVFRSRITMLSAAMALSSPGVAVQTFRLKEMGRDRDPLGQGQHRNVTFGAGNYRGLTWLLNPEDPLDQGFNTLTGVGTDLIRRDFQGFAQRELLDPLTPPVGLPLNTATNTFTNFGETDADRFRPLRSQDGATARAAEWAFDSPFKPLLTGLGVLSEIDGEPVISRNGKEYLDSVVPILGRLEGLVVEQTLGEGRELSQQEIEKRVLNTAFGLTGVPFDLISDANRTRAVEQIGYDFENFEGLVRNVNEFRPDEEGPSVDDLLGG